MEGRANAILARNATIAGGGGLPREKGSLLGGAKREKGKGLMHENSTSIPIHIQTPRPARAHETK